MGCLIAFETTLFDIAREPPNPINPIHGRSLLAWLRDQAQTRVALSEPGPDDWGWFCHAHWQAHPYLIGASADGDDAPGGAVRWALQIHKQRSLLEKVLGRERMSESDAALFFIDLVRGEPAFRKIEVEFDR